MLKNKELKVEIIQLHHDIPTAKHRRRWKITELVTRNYWWPGITKDIGKYMDKHDICQIIKNQTEAPVGKLMANEILKRLWIYLMINFITKLLLVAGKNVILVVCDRLSKIVHFVATIERLARLFRNNVWKLHKLLKSVILDRRSHLVAKLTKKLNKMLEIKTKLLTSFHPQTDR